MDVVKQSAALCLLRLLRTSPEIIPSGEWTSRIIHLLNDQHLGVVTAAASLIEALVKRNTDEYKGCVSLAVSRLSRVSSNHHLLPLFSNRLINSLFSIRLLRPVTRTFRITLITLSRLLGCRLNSCDCFKITRHQVKNNFVHLKNLFVLNNWCLCTEDAGVRGRLTECLETILNKAQEPPKSKKVQHSNAKNAVLFEAISLIIHADR